MNSESGRSRRGWLLCLLLVAIAALGVAWAGAERRAAASCRAFAAPGTEVWLALGQSNAANHAQIRYFAGPRVAAFDGSSCRPARDPLAGGDGSSGSLWTPLAQAWLNEGRAERVLVAVSAREATSVAQWAPGSPLHRRALDTVEALERRGLRVTRILWVQGEADVILDTEGSRYRQGLIDTLAPLHKATGAPVYISLIGRCGDVASPAIRSAQERVIAERGWALPGPDLDRIGAAERFERCHFARSGQARAVALWLAALRGTGG